MVVTLTATTLAMTMPQMVSADAVEKPYLSLGADLSNKDRAEVLDLLGVDGKNLDDYEVVFITNEDEHDYLDNYLSQSVIGSRALSSVLIQKKSDGKGIHVTTKNITYCTEGMYQNALTTAGITDAEVVVAGPFEITGTAALVGAMKAYEDMTGEKIDEITKDTATNELVVTGSLAEDLGDSELAEKLIAMLKEYISRKNISDEEGIHDAIDECEEKLDIELTDSQEDQITALMEKISKLDLDVDQLKEQAKDIYNKISGIEVNGEGLFSFIRHFLQSILDIFQGNGK